MTIVSCLFGRGGSKSLPGKNTMLVHGKRLMEYPILACKQAGVDRLFCSTDDEVITNTAKNHGVEIIPRPDELCTDAALLQDAISHAYHECKAKVGSIKYFVITMCNAANITGDAIKEAISKLDANPQYDSVITVARYEMFAPERARTPDNAGELQPYISFDKFDHEITCDRKSHNPTMFADGGVTVVRGECLEDISKNKLPFQWMGNNISYLEQLPSTGDIDMAWQVPVIEWWLKENGVA